MAKAGGPQSLNLTITNPLVLYRALLATNRIRPDPAQHRLALQLQQLYYRLKDYQPEVEYQYRLQKAAKLSRRKYGSSSTTRSGSSPIEPTIQEEKRKAVFDDDPRSPLSRFFNRDGTSGTAMTKTIPIHDSAMNIDSPQGMLLYGEVGRGKSMLIDLLYDSLPNKKKARWHFNTFMLDIFRRLELARIERALDPGPSTFGVSDHEHVVLSLARDTMETSPILFLDEFQLPDRVAGKLVNGFLMSFFHLGGVLVASSNRMPEELAKAQGLEFASMKGNGKDDSLWGRMMRERFNEGQKAARSDFGIFVDVLKKRCEVWEMEGQKDWRRDDEYGDSAVSVDEIELEEQRSRMGQPAGGSATVVSGLYLDTSQTSQTDIEDITSLSSDMPPHYHVSETNSASSFTKSYTNDIRKLNPSDNWVPTTITVYARPLKLLMTSPENGVALLPFASICAANLGPADYISICSTFHTLVVTGIPVLTLLQKNEARRFITLLDACYEARCRLLIEAAAPPDRLFFPETRTKSGSPGTALGDISDAIESEAFSEMYQDSTAPFRPNVSVYDDTSSSPTMSLHRSDLRTVLADEDADFGPTYGNGRGHGPSSSNQYKNDDEEIDMPGRPAGFAELEKRQGPDFTQTGALTGEDERFAYKRARSRLWEMCGRKWWDKRQGISPDEWWNPVRKEGRSWERSISIVVDNAVMEEVRRNSTTGTTATSNSSSDGISNAVDGSHDGGKRRIDQRLSDNEVASMFKHGASPFRKSAEPPPKFGWQHAWGMMKWGKKAGEWGKGVDGDRSKDKDLGDSSSTTTREKSSS